MSKHKKTVILVIVTVTLVFVSMKFMHRENTFFIICEEFKHIYDKIIRKFKAEDSLITRIYPEDTTLLLCKECKHSYETNSMKYHRWVSANAEPNLFGYKCPKCGKTECYEAYKCEQCGLVFFPVSVKNGYSDTCPKCNFSKIKQIIEIVRAPDQNSWEKTKAEED
ncbi:MAG: hypothetical protein ACYTBP_01215 [Planctomycetota bacterium]|jgi:hypothetical protein